MKDMGRSKKKLPSKQVDGDLSPNDSDDEIPDEIHNRFLENIKEIHGKPKIAPATRNEPAAEVSEFNFQSKKKSAKGKPSFRKEDLLRPLKKKQPRLAQKLEAVKKTSTLPKPLETVYEKKIQREIGFEKVKKQLDRWDDVVQNNRVADQLHFPLKNRKIEVYDHTDDDLFSSFSNPTPLEKELAAVLNSSDVAKQDKEKMEQSKFRLTLREMIEKRKMLSKVRAQASYRVSKARRQNKIKSKKYHRLLRNEKTKQQIKDFETLQKTDPEAALKQLEMLEKSRAEERATLRHRNTGKWARNQVIKAKYNKESRIALSEQLSKNRELTQKRKVEDSDDDSADELDVRVTAGKIDGVSNNPWIADNNDYGQFFTNYKKYWEENTKQTERSDDADAALMNDVGSVFAKKKSGELATRTNEDENDNPQLSTVNTLVGKKKNKKSKKLKSKSVVSEERSEDDVFEESENCLLVSEITNSSGCWTVTESTTKQQPVTKPSKRKKKSAESCLSSNVCEMFKSLEEKISRRLTKKRKEIQDTNNDDENGVEKTEKSDKDKKKRKKKKSKKSNDDTREILDPEANVLEDTQEFFAVEPSSKSSSLKDIDANKFLKVTAKRLATEIPDLITGGDEGIDDDENNDRDYRMTIGEAFAEDDVVAEFEEEKAKIVAESVPKPVDLSLPGWGSWTSAASNAQENKPPKVKRPRLNKRLLFRVPKAPPRKDANKGHVIINEEKTNKMKDHLVSDLPYPFTKVKDFEATIRAPVGRTWIPETAHQQLIAPAVVTKLGTVIEPMDEGELIDRGGL